MYFIDRMMKEYDNRHWGDEHNNNNDNPFAELDYDLAYFRNLVKEEEKRKEGRKKGEEEGKEER